MENTPKITPANIQSPKGGGAIRSMGETFQANPFSGTASLSIPIYTTPCRGSEPQLSLSYNSGNGNGIFGIGFQLAIPNISRKTSHGLPKYDVSDTFIISGADDLVPKNNNDSTYTQTEGSDTFYIKTFLPRVEGLFAKIQQWSRESDGDIHWRVNTKDNQWTVYGRTTKARIADPEDTSRVFKWLIEESWDAKGNRTKYEYRNENRINVDLDANETNQRSYTNTYLSKIKYGPFINKDNEEDWHFEVLFDYGERDPQNPSYEAINEWAKRQDSFSTFKSGFEIRTHRRCQGIYLFHRFEEVVFPVHCTQLIYEDNPFMAFLSEYKVYGYRKNQDDNLQVKSIPPIKMAYLQASEKTNTEIVFKEINTESATPGLLNRDGFLLTDLYGEGLPGIIYTDKNSVFYWRPLGDGQYGTGNQVIHFPLSHNLSSRKLSLTDLNGDGKKNILVDQVEGPGFYTIQDELNSETFQTFNTYPSEYFQTEKALVDVTGNGLADLLIVEQTEIKVYPSLGKEGYESPSVISTGASFPFTAHVSEEEVLLFADFFGDGGNHFVRIRSGLVEVWPNLGYGRFGEKINLNNAPVFLEGLQKKQLFLADIDGSGTTDIIYAYSDRLDVFYNQSGNGFSDPVSYQFPFVIDQFDQLKFADLLGNNTTCLVLSKWLADGQSQNLYYSFVGTQKPYLLESIDNNRGGQTQIKYQASTYYYLQDLKAGKAWKTNLHFPVQLIDSITITDQLTDSRIVSRFAYHDGYFDPTQREFRGFGMVEKWDTEDFDTYYESSQNGENPDSSLHVPPVYTKTWFHTGAFFNAGNLSKQYEEEYYKNESNPFFLPDSILEENMLQSDANTQREAFRALHGSVLRTEVYSQDGSSQEEVPYLVTESNFAVRLIQAKNDNRYAVCLVYPNESIQYHYERQSEDPRIEHEFTLLVDEYGFATDTCKVFYPRQINAPAEQMALKCLYSKWQFIHKTDAFYLLGTPYEEKQYEIGGLDLEEGTYFSIDTLKPILIDSFPTAINFEDSLDPLQLEARLLHWQRHYFWEEDQEDMLILGDVSPQQLLHHSEQAVFSSDLVQSIYEDKVDQAMLEEAGYILIENHWWNPGQKIDYHSIERFYLEKQLEDPLGNISNFEYDNHSLALVKTIDPLNNETIAELDYYTLQAKRITDPNNNISEFIFDPLGQLLVSSIYGTEGELNKGDQPLDKYKIIENPRVEDIIINPEKYLQSASTYAYSNLEAWQETKQPVFAIVLQREIQVSELTDNLSSPIQVQLTYSDGLGRVLQTKAKASAANSQVEEEERWLCSGRTVFNNKAKPIKQYEPYYSSTYTYESENEVSEQGLSPILHYDPLSRLIKVETAKGFIKKIVFNPWEIQHYDENDCLKESEYYQSNKNDAGTEGDALHHAEAHANTPTNKYIDTIGNVFQIHQTLTEDATEEETLASLHETDIQGNLLSSTDPRLSQKNELEDTLHRNFEYRYNMQQQQLWINSADAGQRRILYDAIGNRIVSWDSRNFKTQITYDALQRPLEVYIKGDDGQGLQLDQIVEKYQYGEDYLDDQKYNLRHQLVEHYDQGSWTKFAAYTIQGHPLEKQQRLRIDYKNEANWGDATSSQLEEKTFYSFYNYDALGRLTSKILPDGDDQQSSSQIQYTYHPEGWLQNLSLKQLGQAEEYIVEDINYNAKGQRISVLYGNGVKSNYTYEASTFRLLNLKSTRPIVSTNEEGETITTYETIQDLTYVYDPVGNIIQTEDHSIDTVFNDNQMVEPICQYTYDALYQLAEASGRMHLALTGNEYQGKGQEDFMQSRFAKINDGQQLANYTQKFTYDRGGNLTEINHQGGDNNTWTRKLQVAETSNRAVQQDLIEGNKTVDDFFDVHGNQIQMIHLPKIYWNYRDNMSQVDIVQRDDASNDSEFYVYSSGGHRIRRVTERLINKATAVVEIEEKIYLDELEIKRIRTEDATSLERYSIQLEDDHKRILSLHRWTTDVSNRETDTIDTPSYHYLLDNLIGSVSMELDELANLIAYEEYFPYGGTSFITGNNTKEVQLKEYRYSGKERDGATGLYYYGLRYYAPWLCRWLCPDPAGTVDGLNLYAFVKGNPVSFMDPNGTTRGKAFRYIARRGGSTPTERAKKRMKIMTPGSQPQQGQESLKAIKKWTSADRKNVKGTKSSERIDAAHRASDMAIRSMVDDMLTEWENSAAPSNEEKKLRLNHIDLFFDALWDKEEQTEQHIQIVNQGKEELKKVAEGNYKFNEKNKSSFNAMVKVISTGSVKLFFPGLGRDNMRIGAKPDLRGTPKGTLTPVSQKVFDLLQAHIKLIPKRKDERQFNLSHIKEVRQTIFNNQLSTKLANLHKAQIKAAFLSNPVVGSKRKRPAHSNQN